MYPHSLRSSYSIAFFAESPCFLPRRNRSERTTDDEIESERTSEYYHFIFVFASIISFLCCAVCSCVGQCVHGMCVCVCVLSMPVACVCSISFSYTCTLCFVYPLILYRHEVGDESREEKDKKSAWQQLSRYFDPPQDGDIEMLERQASQHSRHALQPCTCSVCLMIINDRHHRSLSQMDLSYRQTPLPPLSPSFIDS